MEPFSISKTLLIDTTMEDLKPTVMENYEFDYQTVCIIFVSLAYPIYDDSNELNQTNGSLWRIIFFKNKIFY